MRALAAWPGGRARRAGRFLELLRERSTETGALLVFDEVITGFRVARGGAQELTAVMPDLVVMGKILGGGLPAAAYGGRRELMERIAPAGDVYQAGTLSGDPLPLAGGGGAPGKPRAAGTLSGNPLAVAAGRATLAMLDEQAYLRLSSTTHALADGLRDAAAAAGVPVQVSSVTGLLTVFFSEPPVTDYAGAQACDTRAFAAW